ncbi:MAG: response regulator transcription factor [Vallitaleaceae bacterium]|nr:response regulator transcription factor [Vallitaleaceae bacterium]
MKKRILVVDDEKVIVKGIKFSLEQEGYEIDSAYDGDEALVLAKAHAYDLIILDVMLPKKDGLEVCRTIRGFSTMPIIMLTAKGEDMDKILGLEFGADDYMTKPFNILELKARIKAIIRRNVFVNNQKDQESNKSLETGDLLVQTESRRVFVREEEANLTAKEFDLLELFMTHPSKVYSREQLLNIVWGYDYPGDVRTVDVHVRRLREKIEQNPSEPKYIHTKWGVGYYYQQ